MSLSGRIYAVGRAVASRAPAGIQRRILQLRPFSTQTGIWHLPEHKIVYVMVQKVATRSVLAAVTGYALGVDRPATSAEVRHAARRFRRGAFPPEIRALGQTCFTFGFVRNPLDRLLSAYAQQKEAADHLKTIFRQHRIPFDASFAEFVEVIASLPDERCNVHVRSQHRFVSDERGIVVESLGKIERISEDWKILMDRFGFPELPKINTSTHRPAAESYTPELARVAAERYSRDIEMFGYADEVALLTN